MKRSRGRPTKLTDELREEIVRLVQAGNYIETAAAAAGIHKDSLYEWLKRGAKEVSGPHREFSDAVQKAMGFAESRDVLLITKAAATQWQAAAWRLERKFPDRWGRRDSVKHVGPDGGPVAVKAEVQDASPVPARIAGILGLLGRIGALTGTGSSPGTPEADDAEVDAVHPSPTDDPPDGVSSP